MNLVKWLLLTVICSKRIPHLQPLWTRKYQVGQPQAPRWIHLTWSEFFQQKKKPRRHQVQASPATNYENLRRVMLSAFFFEIHVMLSACAIILAYRCAERRKLTAPLEDVMTCFSSRQILISKASSRPSAAISSDSAPYIDSITAWKTFRGWWFCFLELLAFAPWNTITNQGPFRFQTNKHLSTS